MELNEHNKLLAEMSAQIATALVLNFQINIGRQPVQNLKNICRDSVRLSKMLLEEIAHPSPIPDLESAPDNGEVKLIQS